MREDKWWESENPDRASRAVGGRVALWIIAGLLFAGIISGAIFWFSVATSGVKAKGDIIRQNNSAQNQVGVQQHFETLYGDIKSYGLQLVQAKADKDAHPGDAWYATTYTGLFNTCVSAVNGYNQDSAKTLYMDWKTADLPQTIDPASACAAPESPSPNPSH